MKRIVNLFIKVVTVMSLFFMMSILFLSFINNSDLVTFTNIFKYPVFIYLLFSIPSVYLVLCVNKYIDKAKKLKWLKILSWTLLILGQLFIVKLFNPVQITDSYVINNQAISIAKGLEKSVNIANYPYFGQYYNNNFVLVVSIYVAKFCKMFYLDYTLGFTLFNVLMIDSSILLIYLIGKKVKDEKFGTKLLVLSVFNPLNYLLIHWTYTVTYSISGMLLVVYLILLLKDEKRTMLKVLLSTFLGVSVSLGYYMRPTIMIPFIAIVLYFICYLIINKKNIRNYLLSGFIFLLVLIGSYIGVGEFNKQYVQNGDRVWPLTHWVMMGLHGDGTFNAKDNAFTRKFTTREEMKKANIEDIEKTLKDYGVVGLTKHSLKKIGVTWSEGAARYHFRNIQDKNNSSLYNWFFGSKRNFVVIYCQLFRIITLLFAIICIYEELKSNKLNFQFLNILILFGGILFYLIWEAKSSYSVPFLPFIFILSIYGIDYINNKKLKLNDKKVVNIIFSIIVGLTIILGLFLYNPLVKEKMIVDRYSVNITNPVIGVASGISKINRERLFIKQEFVSKYTFNRVCFKTYVLDINSKINYKIKLLSSNKLVKEYIINSDLIKNEKLCLAIDSKLTRKNSKYTIIIEPGKIKKDSIRFANINYKTIDVYDGDMYIGKDKYKKDLVINVYNRSSESFMIKQLYSLVVKCILLSEILTYIIAIKILVIKKVEKNERSSRIINRKK